LKRVTWQELRDVCRLLGCVESRIKGDHLIMTRPGLARPVVIKMDRDLGEDIIRTNMHTLGIDRAEFLLQVDIVRKRRS
jgi:predicted RNA binding protein YcfA (HicA-like mRNA interferase family)